MTTAPSPRRIAFARLSAIPAREILAHMADPRVAAHLPLMTAPWGIEDVLAFVAMKEGAWDRDGRGHQAILLDGEYVGWGGFEKEAEGVWDLGLVLRADRFGLGPAIAARLLEDARADPRIEEVTFLLAPSRRSLRALDRIGAQAEGEAEHAGQRFLRYRLRTA